MIQCLYLCVDGTSMRIVVVVALGCAGEDMCSFVKQMINDRNTALGIFSTEFFNEEEVVYSVDVGLDLSDQFMQGRVEEYSMLSWQ